MSDARKCEAATEPAKRAMSGRRKRERTKRLADRPLEDLPGGLDLLRGSRLPQMSRALDPREHEAVDLLARVGLATQARTTLDGPHVAQWREESFLEIPVSNQC
jgi:hypothetical protein